MENEGSNQLLTEGATEFSKHVASDVHEKTDLEFAVVCKDDNWFSRGVKEAVAIRKFRPTLNQDEGRYNLSPMYDKFIRTSLVMKIPSQGTLGKGGCRNACGVGGFRPIAFGPIQAWSHLCPE